MYQKICKAFCALVCVSGIMVLPIADAKADEVRWSGTTESFSDLGIVLADGSISSVTSIKNTSFGMYKLTGALLTIDGRNAYAVKEETHNDDGRYYYSVGHALDSFCVTEEEQKDGMQGKDLAIAFGGDSSALYSPDKMVGINADSNLFFSGGIRGVLNTTNYSLGVRMWDSGASNPAVSNAYVSASFSNPAKFAIADKDSLAAKFYSVLSGGNDVVLPENANAELYIQTAKNMVINANGGKSTQTNAYVYLENPFDADWHWLVDAPDPVREGYTFGGWSTADTDSHSRVFDPKADTLYATWVKGETVIDTDAPSSVAGKPETYTVIKENGTSIVVVNDKKSGSRAKKPLKVGQRFIKNGITYKIEGKMSVAAVKGRKSITKAKLSTVSFGGRLFLVKSVQRGAFRGCWRLRKVVIGESVHSIGSNAFRGCSSLRSVKVDSSYGTVGKHAFKGIGKKCKFVGDRAFVKKVKKLRK